MNFQRGVSADSEALSLKAVLLYKFLWKRYIASRQIIADRKWLIKALNSIGILKMCIPSHYIDLALLLLFALFHVATRSHSKIAQFPFATSVCPLKDLSTPTSITLTYFLGPLPHTLNVREFM